jgi:hypothetical protein
MSDLDKRVDELEHWKATHELEHKNLRDRLEQELRSKWSTDIKAMSGHVEGILKKQDGELATIRGETEKQTPLLEKTAKEFRANRRARHDRKVQEELYRTWMKRAVTAAIAIGAVLEFIARVLPILKGP